MFLGLVSYLRFTNMVMFLVHISDWTLTLRSTLCIVMFSPFPGSSALILYHVQLLLICYLTIKVLLFQTT